MSPLACLENASSDIGTKLYTNRSLERARRRPSITLFGGQVKPWLLLYMESLLAFPRPMENIETCQQFGVYDQI